MLNMKTLLEQSGGVEILEALEGRGHSAVTIQNMSCREALDEYVAWHLGDRSWGRDFRFTMAALANASDYGPNNTYTDVLLGDAEG